MSEQDLIREYFSHHLQCNSSVKQSIGDDAAIIHVQKDKQLAVSTDTLNIDQHFYANHPPEDLGQKALAVNLSDMAAMGAVPRWATLSLSLPEVDHVWLKSFSQGLYKLADKHDVKIIGGDLVKGALSITIHIIGEINNNSLLRSACEVDELIYVTGFLGDAAFGLRLIREQHMNVELQDRKYFTSKLMRPIPQLDASQIAVKFSNAAIDISDGILVDLQRMLDLSQKGAILDVGNLPLSIEIQKYLNKYVTIEDVLLGGEDYQLLFTIPAENQDELEFEFNIANIPLTNIGKIVEGNTIQLMHSGKFIDLPNRRGFDHF